MELFAIRMSRGVPMTSRADLQFYQNHAQEIEDALRRLARRDPKPRRGKKPRGIWGQFKQSFAAPPRSKEKPLRKGARKGSALTERQRLGQKAFLRKQRAAYRARMASEEGAFEPIGGRTHLEHLGAREEYRQAPWYKRFAKKQARRAYKGVSGWAANNDARDWPGQPIRHKRAAKLGWRRRKRRAGLKYEISLPNRGWRKMTMKEAREAERPMNIHVKPFPKSRSSGSPYWVLLFNYARSAGYGNRRLKSWEGPFTSRAEASEVARRRSKVWHPFVVRLTPAQMEKVYSISGFKVDDYLKKRFGIGPGLRKHSKRDRW